MQAGKRRAKTTTMTEGEELIELRFRIYDGIDIAHGTYEASMTVSTLKQRIIAEWPQGYILFLFTSFLLLTYS